MRRLVFGLLWLGACGGSAPRVATPQQPTVEEAAVAAAPAPAHFVENDLDAALDQARRSKRLLLVDGWAPWCHTCLSMQHEVLGRPELGELADRYVFASIDTDRPESERFVERYAQKVWPTFFVIDPSDGAVLAMHGGGASLDELVAFLEQASRNRSRPGDVALREAHDAFTRRDLPSAAQKYREAAALVGADRRAEALLGAMRALHAAGHHEACVELGRAELRAVQGSAAPGDFTYYLGACARSLGEGELRTEALALAERRLRELVDSPPPGASLDDRSDVAAMLATALRERGEVDEARRVELARLGWLERAAAEAPSPAAAQVHDYARMNAYLALGRSADAIAMLEERTRQLPQSYEAHARLSQARYASGAPRLALPPLERAIELSYGRRRLSYMGQRVRIYQALHRPTAPAHSLDVPDVEGLERALREERAAWLELPERRREEARIAELDAALSALRAQLGAPKR